MKSASHWFINSLAPDRFEQNFRQENLKLILLNNGWGISYEGVLRWISLDFTDDKSTLVQMMVWWCQATSHYLRQYWLRSMWSYDVTRPQCVNYCLVGVAMETMNAKLLVWQPLCFIIDVLNLWREDLWNITKPAVCWFPNFGTILISTLIALRCGASLIDFLNCDCFPCTSPFW